MAMKPTHNPVISLIAGHVRGKLAREPYDFLNYFGPDEQLPSVVTRRPGVIGKRRRAAGADGPQERSAFCQPQLLSRTPMIA
jgi:hypothetical protein